MIPLLWRSSLRYHSTRPWQLLLAILGITLGVAVVTAVDLANESARRAFALSVEATAGKATHQIGAGETTLPESLYLELRLGGLRPSAPVVEGYLSVSGRSFRLLGIDPFAEAPFRNYLEIAGGGRSDLAALLTRPGAVLMAAETAEALQLERGAHFSARVGGRVRLLELAGFLPATDLVERRAQEGLLVADIATTQELLGLQGRLSRIDLILPDADPRSLAQIEAGLPPGVRVERAAARVEVMEQMTRAFSINLTALSLLALVVGMFLIYNTMTFSVIQRRPLIGTLRALGTSQAEIFRLVGTEALMLGVIGTALGLLLGMGLAGVLVRLVTRTINDLYFVLDVTGVFLTPLSLLKGVALGLAATLIAALKPALDATRTPPRQVMSRSFLETHYRQGALHSGAVGLLLLLFGALLLALPGDSLMVGFAALAAFIFGFAFAVPQITLVLMGALQQLVGQRAGFLLRLAVRGLSASVSRTGIAIAALSVAIAATIGMGIMIDSFRQTVAQWLEHYLQADIYISALDDPAVTPLPEHLVSTVRQAPGVHHVSTYWQVEVDSDVGPIELAVLQLAPESDRGYHFKSGERQRAVRQFHEGALLVSEPFAFHHRVEVGDHIELLTPKGSRSFPVAGIFYHYGTSRGTVQMARAVYLRHWREAEVSSLGVYVEPESDVEQVVNGLRRALEQEALEIRSNRGLREASLQIFDRTFAITAVLRLLAMLIAFVGVISALMALQLERSREFGILRATGMTPAELWRMVTAQTGLMGLTAGLLAIPLGLVLALVLILVINRRAFGWSLLVEIPPGVVFEGVLLAIVAALLAGLVPARRMAATPPAEALREE